MQSCCQIKLLNNIFNIVTIGDGWKV